MGVCHHRRDKLGHTRPIHVPEQITLGTSHCEGKSLSATHSVANPPPETLQEPMKWLSGVCRTVRCEGRAGRRLYGGFSPARVWERRRRKQACVTEQGSLYASSRERSSRALPNLLQGLGFPKRSHQPRGGSCGARTVRAGFQRPDCASEGRQAPGSLLHGTRTPCNPHCAHSDHVLTLTRENAFHCNLASCPLNPSSTLLPSRAVAAQCPISQSPKEHSNMPEAPGPWWTGQQ